MDENAYCEFRPRQKIVGVVPDKRLWLLPQPKTKAVHLEAHRPGYLTYEIIFCRTNFSCGVRNSLNSMTLSQTGVRQQSKSG